MSSSSQTALLITKETSSQSIYPLSDLLSEVILPSADRIEIGDILISEGFSSMGGRFITCREPESQILFICGSCGNVEIKPSSCNVRFCPRCNSRKYRLLTVKFGSGISRMSMPSFLSLGYPNVKKLDRDALNYATQCFSKLRRSPCFAAVKGGFYDIDVTMNPSSLTFNVHIHAVIDAPYLDRDAIYARWLKITSDLGGSTRNVYIERAYAFVDGKKVTWHPRRKLHIKQKILAACSGYMIRHATKAPVLPDNKSMAAFLMAAYGKRMLQGFGNMFDLPPIPAYHMLCSECGATDFKFSGFMVALANWAKNLMDRPLRSCKSYCWDAG